ncbi:hypothetical protein N9L60_00810 [Flavobacteriales bacterium]|nr:hypothetical protein [Flavobacteriales bacterium]CAI8156619.1 MAG: Uncharacterised protein [Crocinitomicaceae bacterium]
MKSLFTNLFLMSLAFGVSSCSSSSDEVNSQEAVEVVTEELAEEATNDNVFYQMPTPNELFAVLKNSDAPFNKEILNDVSNSGNYLTKFSKALNFGVFTADLAYATSQGSFEDAASLFEAIQSLSKDLEIENAIDQIIFERLKENLDNANADSLFYLSNETYYSAFSYLEENDRQDVLGMIAVGGWIEGLNIILNLEPYSEDSEICQRIADQKLTLENLLIFVSDIENDKLTDLVSDLSVIEEIFNEESENSNDESTETEVVNSTNEDGVMVFGGGNSVSLSNSQFDQLKSTVMDLRTSIIEGN